MSGNRDDEHLTEGEEVKREVTTWCILAAGTRLRVQERVHMLPEGAMSLDPMTDRLSDCLVRCPRR